MGYYNNVYIALSKKLPEKKLKEFEKFFNKLRKEYNKKRILPTIEKEHAVYYQLNDMKWHTDYSMYIEDFLSTLKDKYYGFIRNGEIENDIDCRGDYFYYMNIQTTINIDQGYIEIGEDSLSDSESK